jgi:rhodanese-related sulfurtransferase
LPPFRGFVRWYHFVVPEFPLEISPGEVKSRLEKGDPLRLIDVREPEEHAICRIEGARLIPMRAIPQHLNELDDDGAPLIVYCHHGVRSLNVVDWLRRQGLADCQSLAGGIDLWSLTVDPSMPRY